MDLINRLTEKIDNYGSINVRWVSTEIHHTLWEDLNDLRNFKPENKENAMRDWKYKEVFEANEIAHLNEKKVFIRMSWEESFCLGMLFMHYH